MIDALDVRTLFFVMTATALLAAVATTTIAMAVRTVRSVRLRMLMR